MTREEEIKFRDECAKIAFGKHLSVSMGKVLQASVSEDQLNQLLEATAEQSFDYAEAMLEEKKKRDEKLS